MKSTNLGNEEGVLDPLTHHNIMKSTNLGNEEGALDPLTVHNIS